MQGLLVDKATEGVEVKIIVWEPRLILRLLPGAGEHGINGRADEVAGTNESAKRYEISDRLAVRIDSTAPTLISAHNEKIVIMDNQIGFCGGLYLSRANGVLAGMNTTFPCAMSILIHGMTCI